MFIPVTPPYPYMSEPEDIPLRSKLLGGVVISQCPHCGKIGYGNLYPDGIPPKCDCEAATKRDTDLGQRPQPEGAWS